ncbi:hypothetical protein GE061_017378 [Apolygus lucorum]|uniref:Uncharacterized protein n=1 Tax=Apolygus lucorum TaxID=248454 RepID=A0A8S9XB09_APOLU|nr:hypothetical protein GE061_017378 [Apolygus lucorum]
MERASKLFILELGGPASLQLPPSRSILQYYQVLSTHLWTAMGVLPFPLQSPHAISHSPSLSSLTSPGSFPETFKKSMSFLRHLLRTGFLRFIRRHVMTKVDAPLGTPSLTSQNLHITTSELKKDGEQVTADVKPTPCDGKVSPDADKLSSDRAIATMRSKWAELETKLPVWQTKIADGMQSVQDFITSRFIK